METSPLQILIYARHTWLLSSQEFFNVPHLLGHGTFVYNPWHSHLVPNAERLAVELFTNFFYDLGLSRLLFEQPTACEANVLMHCDTAVVIYIWFLGLIFVMLSMIVMWHTLVHSLKQIFKEKKVLTFYIYMINRF